MQIALTIGISSVEGFSEKFSNESKAREKHFSENRVLIRLTT